MSRSGTTGRLPWFAAGLLSVGCVVVPCLFTTRLRDVFVVPKLAALWVLLIAGLVLVAVSPLVGQPTGRPLRWCPAVDIPGISFVVLTVLATAFSTDRHQSLFGERLQYQGLLIVFLYGGLFLLARHVIVDARRLTLLFSGITAGAVVVAGYALLQKAGLDPFWKGFLPDGRVFSTFGQPNALAAYLVIALPPACHLARVTRGAARAVVSVATAGIVGALLLTLSRGGLVGLVALTIVPLGVLLRRRLASAVAGVVVVASAGALSVPAVRSAFSSLSPRRGGQGQLSAENHLDQWRVAGRIALDHPLLGTGPETFPDVFPRFSRDVLSPERAVYFDAFRVESAHNVYLTMAANTGLPTLLAYLVLVGAVLVLMIRMAGSAEDEGLRLGLLALAAAALGHLATDGFMSAEVTSTGLFWILLGAGIGIGTSPSHAEEAESDSRITASGRFHLRRAGRRAAPPGPPAR